MENDRKFSLKVVLFLSGASSNGKERLDLHISIYRCIDVLGGKFVAWTYKLKIILFCYSAFIEQIKNQLEEVLYFY